MRPIMLLRLPVTLHLKTQAYKITKFNFVKIYSNQRRILQFIYVFKSHFVFRSVEALGRLKNFPGTVATLDS